MTASNGAVLKWSLGVIGVVTLAVVTWLCSSAFGQEGRLVGLETERPYIRDQLKELKQGQKDICVEQRVWFEKIERKLEGNP